MAYELEKRCPECYGLCIICFDEFSMFIGYQCNYCGWYNIDLEIKKNV